MPNAPAGVANSLGQNMFSGQPLIGSSPGGPSNSGVSQIASRLGQPLAPSVVISPSVPVSPRYAKVQKGIH